MKKYSSLFRLLFLAFAALFITGCVHDDKYDEPVLDGTQCQDLTSTLTIGQVKALYTGTTYEFPADSKDIMEGYVSSTDESGNIYKTIYIQDAPENPTQGFVISVDAVSTYTKFPQGTKVYIKLNGLALGTYGGLVQLGVKDPKATSNNSVARIPEKQVSAHIFRSCTVRENIVPKVLTLAEMSANDNLLGALIQVNNAEFDSKFLCSSFAPDGVTVDRQINDPTSSLTTRVVRNSGYASFANQKLPAGKGALIGIFSKFNSTYQIYINRVEDLADMNKFPRKDGITKDPCTFEPGTATMKTVAEIKKLYNGSLTPITGDIVLKARVTANDESGNLYKQIYVQDATGGIRVNINKLNLHQDYRFKVGKEIYIKLNGLYVGNANGEMQIGQPYNGNVGQIDETSVYKTFYDSNSPLSVVPATERTISQLTTDDVGKWIKIKNVQFIEADLGKTYASGGITNRTLEDCSGNKIIVRTSNYANFAGVEVDGGKGDVSAILSIYNGTYQLWIPKQIHADLDNPRCDGTVPATFDTVFEDGFESLANWTAVNVLGTQVWSTTNFGNPRPSAFMDGARQPNEDWLVSKKISLAGFKDAFLSFETDGRYNGNPLEVYITTNYTGNVGSTSWTKLEANLDQDLNGYAGFVNSGRVNLKNYVNKEIVVAFKYTSVNGAATAWEVDNFAVKGTK